MHGYKLYVDNAETDWSYIDRREVAYGVTAAKFESSIITATVFISTCLHTCFLVNAGHSYSDDFSQKIEILLSILALGPGLCPSSIVRSLCTVNPLDTKSPPSLSSHTTHSHNVQTPRSDPTEKLTRVNSIYCLLCRHQWTQYNCLLCRHQWTCFSKMKSKAALAKRYYTHTHTHTHTVGQWFSNCNYVGVTEGLIPTK